jgi:uncharacterized integral membrane protein
MAERDQSSERSVVTHSPSGTTREPGGGARRVAADQTRGGAGRGAGVAAGAVALVVAAVLIVVVVAQNGERVEFEFLAWDADVSLALLVLIAAVVALVIDQVVGMVWRHRRRRARAMASEMRDG